MKCNEKKQNDLPECFNKFFIYRDQLAKIGRMRGVDLVRQIETSIFSLFMV